MVAMCWLHKLNYAFADMLIMVQSCVILMVLECHKCVPRKVFEKSLNLACRRNRVEPYW